MSNHNIEHGAMVVFKYDGKKFPLGQNMDITERTVLANVDPVGTPETVEHVRVAYEVDLSCTMYRSAEKTLKALGLFPETADPVSILEHSEITIEVEDIINNLTLERLTGFKAEENSRSYTKGQLTMYNVRGKAIKSTDEAEN